MRQQLENIRRQLESSNPYICLYSEKIEEYFSKLAHTPDHPPYASMIQRAIIELNKEGGSSEEAISKFIKAEYEDLPMAHSTQLMRHLQRLVNKGEIVITSANCYMLLRENSNSPSQLKKEYRCPRRHGRNRKNIRQRKSKGTQLQEKITEESREQNQVHMKISKGFEEQNQVHEQQNGSIGEQKIQGQLQFIEAENELEELQLKVVEGQIEAEQDGQGNEEHNQMQEHRNQQPLDLSVERSQVLSETIDVIIEENCEAEGSNHSQKSSGATEAEQDGQGNEEHNQMQERENQQPLDLTLERSQVWCETIDMIVEQNCQVEGCNQAQKSSGASEAKHHKEQEDEVIVGVYHREQKSKRLEEKNEIANQGSKVGDKQAQLLDIQIEEMMEQSNQEMQHFELSEAKNRLLEQRVEVCRLIIDLSNMLLQFIKKDKEDEATVSTQNYVTIEEVDLSGSSHLTKDEFIELLKKTNKAEGKLIDIISSLNLEMSENSNLMPKTGGQEELLLQTENAYTGNETGLVCDFQPKQPQQLENCGKIKVADYQSKIVSAFVSLPTESMQLMQNQQIKPPSSKRPPEIETMALEKLSEKQNKQMRPCGQDEALQSQPTLMEIGLVMPCDSPVNENNTQSVQRIETVLNDDSITSEPKIKFSREATISTRKKDESYLVVSMHSEQLNNSKLCNEREVPEPQLVTSSLSVPMEIQGLELEHQQQTTFNNNVKGSEYKQSENPIEGRYIEQELVAVEHLPKGQQQMAGQGQQAQLKHPGENPSNSRSDTAAKVAEQCNQTKQKEEQQQLRRSRTRGPRPSKPELVCTINEADKDLTLSSLKLELKEKLWPSTFKRPKKQQRNLHGQKKPIKSQPTILTSSSIVFAKQQANGRLRSRPLKPEDEDSLRSDSVVQKTREEPSLFRHQQHGQEQQQLRRRGRPPKLKSDADTASGESMASKHQRNGQHESHRQDQGRPRRPDINADITLQKSLLSNQQNCNENQPHHPWRGKRPKSNLVATTDASRLSQHQFKHSKSRQAAALALESSQPSQQG